MENECYEEETLCVKYKFLPEHICSMSKEDSAYTSNMKAPTKLNAKLKNIVFRGLSLTLAKMARNRIKVKAPQKMAVNLVPVSFE